VTYTREPSNDMPSYAASVLPDNAATDMKDFPILND